MGDLTTELAGETRKRQDEAKELGRSAGKYAEDKLVDHLRDKHCLTDEEREAFDKGLEEGRKAAQNG